MSCEPQVLQSGQRAATVTIAMATNGLHLQRDVTSGLCAFDKCFFHLFIKVLLCAFHHHIFSCFLPVVHLSLSLFHSQCLSPHVPQFSHFTSHSLTLTPTLYHSLLIIPPHPSLSPLLSLLLPSSVVLILYGPGLCWPLTRSSPAHRKWLLRTAGMTALASTLSHGAQHKRP